jgi:hypothetical protein
MKELADPLLEEIERLRTAIRDAPCIRGLLSGLLHGDNGLCGDCMPDCWKRKALKEPPE